MTSNQILVVEDEVSVAEPLLYVLRNEGFEATHVTLGLDALSAYARQPFDLVVLDIGLPDGTGFDLLRKLRLCAGGAEVPVLFLTARGDEIDRVLGLELGADDYVVKPFSPREVAARIRAILRRGKIATATPAAGIFGCWQHLPESLRIRYHNVTLDLTRNEYRLLTLLLSQPGRVFAREVIMAQVWADAMDSSDRTIDAHIKTMRAKLRVIRPDTDPIHTHRGMGYSLELE